MDVLADAVGRALEGRVLTREELALEVEQITGSEAVAEWVRFSWGSYLKAASFRGLICFAPSTGSSVRFISATEDAHLPRAWLDLSGGARERPDGRGLEAHAQGPAIAGRDRALRQVAGMDTHTTHGRGGASGSVSRLSAGAPLTALSGQVLISFENARTKTLANRCIGERNTSGYPLLGERRNA
jgi:hypothetical protein